MDKLDKPLEMAFEFLFLKSNHDVINNKKYFGYFKNIIFTHKDSGRVATFIKDTIDSKNIPIIFDCEVIAKLVKFQKSLSLSKIYTPSNKIFIK